MKIVIGLILLGITLGIAIETYNYHNFVHANAVAIAQMQYEVLGYSEAETAAGIAALPPLQVRYWNEFHMPWILSGSAWGGFGGILVGSVTGYVRRRKPLSSDLGEDSELGPSESSEQNLAST